MSSSLSEFIRSLDAKTDLKPGVSEGSSPPQMAHTQAAANAQAATSGFRQGRLISIASELSAARSPGASLVELNALGSTTSQISIDGLLDLRRQLG